MTLTIRPARLGEAGLVLSLVRELAEYEQLLHTVDATEDMIGAVLFCDNPRVFCDLAEWNGAPAGFALWFLNYSTFRGRHVLFLEDLFVRPAYRRNGIGRALLAHLAKRCLAQGHARLEWAVLDWNTPAIAFYRAIGAVVMDDWKICRLSRSALEQMAGEDAR